MEVIETTATSGRDHEDLRETATGHDHSPGRGWFVPENILQDFNVSFLDYDLCRAWVMIRLHPVNPHCPRCGAAIPGAKLQRFWQGKRITCHVCRKFFTALTGTFVSGCQLDFRGLVLLAVLLALGVHDKKIAAIVGMSAENVRLWRRKFAAIEFMEGGKR